MNNNERIEAYFNNELPEVDKQQLLRDIDSDTTLKAEYQFQQNVIDGIKAYRKEELIARLDNIQIASGPSLLVKTIGIVGMATMITVGGYMWLNKDDNQPIAQDKANDIEQIVILPEETNEIAVTDNNSEPADEETVSIQPIAESIEKEVRIADAESKVTPDMPNIVVPDVEEPESGATIDIDEDLTAPEALASSTVRLSTSTDVEVKFSKKHNFHYQVKDGGLILFGDFNGSPFEVIELKTNQGINSYLYFKDHFYSLLSDSEEIQPLITIENKLLIEELQKRR